MHSMGLVKPHSVLGFPPLPLSLGLLQARSDEPRSPTQALAQAPIQGPGSPCHYGASDQLSP